MKTQIAALVISLFVVNSTYADDKCDTPKIDESSFAPSLLNSVKEIADAVTWAQRPQVNGSTIGCLGAQTIAVEAPAYPEAIFRFKSGQILISNAFVDSYARLNSKDERNLYLTAVAGIAGFFIVGPQQRWTVTWGFQEALNFVGWRSPLGSANRSIVRNLCQQSEELCFGLGVYRALTFPLLRSEEARYVAQITQPTISEIQMLIALSNSDQAAARIDRLNELARSVHYTELGKPFVPASSLANPAMPSTP